MGNCGMAIFGASVNFCLCVWCSSPVCVQSDTESASFIGWMTVLFFAHYLIGLADEGKAKGREGDDGMQ